MLNLFNNYYENKRVLITGHGGFKGAWLAYWLTKLGAKVLGYSTLVDSNPRMYDILGIEELLEKSVIDDICNEEKLNQEFQEFQPEIVFHMAAQSLVRPSYTHPIETYQSNVMGTLYVLLAAKNTPSVHSFINLTTDKCYENIEQNHYYKENDPLGGYDIYSSSKACAEILTSSFRRSFLQNHPMALASVRAGNVIGGGDWALDRLVPDCIRAFIQNKEVHIRNPLAVRPWQHVLEPLAGYLLLGQKLGSNPQKFATAYNFGPYPDGILNVAEVAKLVAEFWDNDQEEKNAKVIVAKADDLHEAGLLQLDISKAKNELGFQPIWNAKEAIEHSVAWYKMFYQQKHINIQDYTDIQLQHFINIATEKKAYWTL